MAKEWEPAVGDLVEPVCSTHSNAKIVAKQHKGEGAGGVPQWLVEETTGRTKQTYREWVERHRLRKLGDVGDNDDVDADAAGDAEDTLGGDNTDADEATKRAAFGRNKGRK